MFFLNTKWSINAVHASTERSEESEASSTQTTHGTEEEDLCEEGTTTP